MKTTEYAFDGLMVLEYQSGNKKSLSILVKRHHKRLCYHAYRYTNDIEASKDIVQDAWGVIIKKMGTLKEPNSFSRWTTTIVTRKSLDYLKTIKMRGSAIPSNLEEPIAMNEEVDSAQRVVKVLMAIQELPHDQQMVLKLFYTEEYSLKEVSEILGIAVGTTKSRLFHAREKLKQIVKSQNNEKGQ